MYRSDWVGGRAQGEISGLLSAAMFHCSRPLPPGTELKFLLTLLVPQASAPYLSPKIKVDMFK